MGGTIGVESVEGTGSTFTVTLELDVARAVAAPEPPALEETPGHRVQPPRYDILLAEDVALNQQLAVAILTRSGHRVDVVDDGAAAIDAVQRKAYDMVLMDVQMPTVDGLEATRSIRALGGRFATLPIIAMTANVLPDDVARFLAAGMNDHLGKPFAPRAIDAAIIRWCPARPFDDSARAA